jgi:hypothetical protein
MIYDAKIIDRLVAIKLRNLSGTEPDCTVDDGWAAATAALEINDHDLMKIGASRAWALAWDLAIGSAAVSLNNPAGDGCELREIISDIRARYEADVVSESDEREITRRNQRRSSREDRETKAS